jgi:alkylation response protein AidB-like acyl-CoA dehydrogenase
MNFELSEEQRAFAESVRRFAQDQLSSGALARAHSPEYPWDIARLLAGQGLLGIAFPEADGGQGGTLMHAVLAIQEGARPAAMWSDWQLSLTRDHRMAAGGRSGRLGTAMVIVGCAS